MKFKQKSFVKPESKSQGTFLWKTDGEMIKIV